MSEAVVPRGLGCFTMRYGSRIAMTEAERDAYLAQQLTCRLATISASGAPHITPLYFVWSEGRVWVSSLVRSARWNDIVRDQRVSVLVDSGDRYQELCGVEITGTAAVVGEVPRTGVPHPAIDAIEASISRKYPDSLPAHDGKHAWLTVTPTRIISWDFKKLTGGGSS
jgi:hypothetical protein